MVGSLVRLAIIRSSEVRAIGIPDQWLEQAILRGSGVNGHRFEEALVSGIPCCEEPERNEGVDISNAGASGHEQVYIDDML